MIEQKLWGGRFQENTNAGVEAFTASIQFDAQLALEDILGSLAHAKMLHHCEILTTKEYEQIKQGLQKIAQTLHSGHITFSQHDEDIHMNIERLLHKEIGEVAGKLHTARSRNDQVALDIHLYVRKEIVSTINLLIQLQKTLFAMARNHRDIIVPGYTHLQRAQPIYLAQHWLAYVSMLQRDVERLQDNWTRANQCPLGAGALAGSSFIIDREFVANALGFDNIYLNSMDAVSDRDFIVEFLATASLIMMHLSRLSEELILWSSQEFNFIRFADAYCTGSSIMPQKKNPDVAELARGKTGRVYGALFNLLTLLKGLPLSYNKDLQEDKEPLFDTVKTVQTTLAIYAPLLSTLQINVQTMKDAAEEGFLNATALAEYLVKKGLSFRKCHHIVGQMVAHCLARNCKLEELSLAEMQQFSLQFSADVYQILAIEHVAAQQSYAKFLDKEIAEKMQKILEYENWLAQKNTLLSSVITDIFNS